GFASGVAPSGSRPGRATEDGGDGEEEGNAGVARRTRGGKPGRGPGEPRVVVREGGEWSGMTIGVGQSGCGEGGAGRTLRTAWGRREKGRPGRTTLCARTAASHGSNGRWVVAGLRGLGPRG